MKISATSVFRPRAGGTQQFIEAKVTPGVRAGVEAIDRLIFDESQLLVPVRTGELKASGHVKPIEETGSTVKGGVEYTAAHAAYNEFGTGQRGAASPGAGPYPYSSSWPGMPATPYLRPALDIGRRTGREVFASQVALSLKK